jgi:hypothetical protein
MFADLNVVVDILLSIFSHFTKSEMPKHWDRCAPSRALHPYETSFGFLEFQIREKFIIPPLHLNVIQNNFLPCQQTLHLMFSKYLKIGGQNIFLTCPQKPLPKPKNAAFQI